MPTEVTLRKGFVYGSAFDTTMDKMHGNAAKKNLVVDTFDVQGRFLASAIIKF